MPLLNLLPDLRMGRVRISGLNKPFQMVQQAAPQGVAFREVAACVGPAIVNEGEPGSTIGKRGQDVFDGRAN
jgi:hypothetical protein